MKENNDKTKLDISAAGLFFGYLIIIIGLMILLSGCSKNLFYMVTDKQEEHNGWATYTFDCIDVECWDLIYPENTTFAPDTTYFLKEVIFVNKRGKIHKLYESKKYIP